jgi:hypothetical protein
MNAARSCALVALIASAGCAWSPLPRSGDPRKWRTVPGGGETRIGPSEPECLSRGTAEFSLWIQARYGLRVSPDRQAALGASIGSDVTFPIAHDDNLRIGPWLQLGVDMLDAARAGGGLAVLLGGLPDPHFISGVAGTHGEGALGLQLGAGWRGLGTLDQHSDGAQASARLTFGSRRYTEISESGNAYDVCDGSSHGIDPDNGSGNDLVWVGHYGPGYAYGMRVFFEVEQSLDTPTTQLFVGLEFDPITMLAVERERNIILVSHPVVSPSRVADSVPATAGSAQRER